MIGGDELNRRKQSLLILLMLTLERKMSDFKCVYSPSVASATIVTESNPLANDSDVEDNADQADPYKRDHWSRGAEFLFSCIAM